MRPRDLDLPCHAGQGGAAFLPSFSFGAAYTLSKSIDDTVQSVNGGLTPTFGYLQNVYDRRAERALTTFDVPQHLVLSYIYELPIGPGKRFLNVKGAVGKIIGGWQINGVTEFESGTPLQISGEIQAQFGGQFCQPTARLERQECHLAYSATSRLDRSLTLPSSHSIPRSHLGMRRV